MSYNTVTEVGDTFVLNKRTEFPAFAVFPFKNIIIESAFSKGKMFLRRLIYPKAEYDREDVEQVAASTVNCPYCMEGTKIVPYAQDEMVKWLKAPHEQEDESRMESIFGKMLSKLGENGLVSYVKNQHLGLGLSVAQQMISTWGLSDAWMKLLMKGVIGGIETGVSLLAPATIPGGAATKVILYNAGMSTLVSAADPTEQDRQAIKAGARQFAAQWTSMGPVEAVKGLFGGLKVKMGWRERNTAMGQRFAVESPKTERYAPITPQRRY